jgi:hypothetical protein
VPRHVEIKNSLCRQAVQRGQDLLLGGLDGHGTDLAVAAA